MTVTSTLTQLRQVETVTAGSDSDNDKEDTDNEDNDKVDNDKEDNDKEAAGGMGQSAKVGAGIGGAVGGLALIFAVVWLWKRKKNKEDMSYTESRLGPGYHHSSSTALQLSEMKDGKGGGHGGFGAPPTAYLPGQHHAYEVHGISTQSPMPMGASPGSMMPAAADAVSIMSATTGQGYASPHLAGGFNNQQPSWGTPPYASPTPPPPPAFNGPYQAYSPLGPPPGPIEMPAESVPREVYEMPAR